MKSRHSHQARNRWAHCNTPDALRRRRARADAKREALAAMCQRHHLAYDAEHHRANSWATRRARSGTAEIF